MISVYLIKIIRKIINLIFSETVHRYIPNYINKRGLNEVFTKNKKIESF